MIHAVRRMSNHPDDLMAAAGGGGFDAVFVETLSERLTCSICQLALKEPKLTECGHHFCASCLTKSLRRAPSCPICRKELDASKIYPDNAVKREILNLKIKCPRCERGCEWVGELRNGEDHEERCEYVTEACDNNCGKKVIRKGMEHHKKEQCLRRRVKCKHCSLSMEWMQLEDHYKECHSCPMSCSYNCGKTLPRYLMADHTGRQGKCPNSPLDCDFKRNGCQFRGKRNELLKHIETNTASHLSLVAMELAETKEKLEQTESKLAIVESRRSDDPLSPFVYTWRIENWSQKVLDAKAGRVKFIKSNTFYVRPGYHLYLWAFPNGDRADAVAYLGVFLCAREGDFDCSVRWPFPFLINLKSWINNLMRKTLRFNWHHHMEMPSSNLLVFHQERVVQNWPDIRSYSHVASSRMMLFLSD